MSLLVLEISDLLAWWSVHRGASPAESQMAFDLLAGSSMSAQVKRPLPASARVADERWACTFTGPEEDD